MRSTGTRFLLALLASFTAVAVSQAQTGAPQHHNGPVPSPQVGTPMPDAAAQRGQPRAMGTDMGRMMETIRPMMADRGGMGMPFERAEVRIAYLKAELQITDAQSTPWNAFADTIPDRMAAQHRTMSVRIEMMVRSDASSKVLYAALSVDQRKEFDQMMSSPMGMM